MHQVGRLPIITVSKILLDKLHGNLAQVHPQKKGLFWDSGVKTLFELFGCPPKGPLVPTVVSSFLLMARTTFGVFLRGRVNPAFLPGRTWSEIPGGRVAFASKKLRRRRTCLALRSWANSIGITPIVLLRAATILGVILWGIPDPAFLFHLFGSSISVIHLGNEMCLLNQYNFTNIQFWTWVKLYWVSSKSGHQGLWWHCSLASEVQW